MPFSMWKDFIVRVFVTGATGFIGAAVVSELIAAGHQVLGLARSAAAAASLASAGAEVHRGALDNLDSLRGAAATSDGVIHAAFVHDDFSDYAGAAQIDRRAVETLGGALAGSDRPFVVTSVTTLLAPARLGMEQDAPDPGSESVARIASEEAAMSTASRGVRVSLYGSRRRSMAKAITALSRPSFRSRGPREFRRTQAMGPIAGPPCTDSTLRTCTGWRWKRRRQARDFTRLPRRACRSATSLASSVGD